VNIEAWPESANEKSTRRLDSRVTDACTLSNTAVAAFRR
jgi:hypothetical protein